MAGRAGGQILRDVLRRKMAAMYDDPLYDDQGQEMSMGADGTYEQKPMKNPNPDGTFDGPTGGRPINPPDKNGQTGRPDPDKGRRARLMERAKAQGAPYGYGYEDADEDTLEENDALEAYINEEDQKRRGRPGNDGFNSTNPFIQATADAGGDAETMQAVLGAAEQMGMNGVPIEQMMAYDAELDEGGPDYVFKSPEERKAMLQEAYQRGASKAKNQMNKNMGKPFR